MRLGRLLPVLLLLSSSGRRTPSALAQAQTAGTARAPAGGGGGDDDSPENFERAVRLCDGKASLEPMEMVLPLLRAHRADFKGGRILNIGARAGLLALYAARLGAAKVVATDDDARALECLRDNARRLGLDSVVETRRTNRRDPSAFSRVADAERFEVILTAQVERVNRIPRAVSGAVDEGIGPADSIRSAISLIDGLQKHLSKAGTAVLVDASVVLHDIIARLARRRGYAVEQHPSPWIQDSDWCALYNSFAADVARSEGVDPGALLIAPSEESSCGGGSNHFVRIDWTYESLGKLPSPRLWGRPVAEVYPGVIVLRKGSGPPEPLPKDGGRRIAAWTDLTHDAPEEEYFASAYLKGRVHICRGTEWPEHTEPFMMPLMAENREQFPGRTVLDVGTGSGIMALYAAQLGAAKVVATDIKPAAVACARENARKLGLDSVVDARLVALSDPSAYSTIRPKETFDIIVSLPPSAVDRQSFAAAGAVEPGIRPNDHIRLAFSIIDGLRARLRPNGAAVLYYGSAVIHQLVAAYARRLGYAVADHPALLLAGSDWCALYNSFAARVARTEGIDPGALLLPQADGAFCDQGHSAFEKVNWKKRYSAQQLWAKESREVLPGMIVIRKQEPSHAPPTRP